MSVVATRPLALKRTLIGRPRASGRAARDAALEAARAPDLRLRPAVVGRVRDRGRARRPDRRLGDRRPSTSCRSRSRSRRCWRSSSSRTCRRSAPTRRAAAPTSSRGRTSARCRASSPRRRCSSTTSSPSPSRSPPASSRSPRRRRRSPATRSTLSLGFIVLLTVVNLRGVRESGILFALPTYAFVAAMFAARRDGSRQVRDGGCHQAHAPDPIAAGAGGGRACSSCCRRSPPARPRSPGSRRSRTASAPSGGPPGATRPGRCWRWA